MDLVDRIYSFDRILRHARYPVSRATLQERLECSRATVGRIIGEMRDFFGAPIEYDRSARGYRYAETEDGPYELPGLWFNASELHSLLAAHQLLSNAQPGLLEADLAPLRVRIQRILKARGIDSGEAGRRVRILCMAARRLEPEPFRTVAGAVLGRHRLHLAYHGRARDERTERQVSPQRLTHYRDNWYLDAWDHSRRALRSFSVDRILSAQQLPQGAKDIADARLDEHFATAYGIFAGKPKHTALLRFSGESARWVADEVWHPDQRGWHEGEEYFLEIPYADPRELIRDILKHGADVTVISPLPLRAEVERCLKVALNNYV
ncbi:MAG: helix-turn-helix transcriptional regulator [Candidatus Methylomirabilia bacterium]